MYRFNGVDRRLERACECVLMLIEAMEGNPYISFDIYGHSGDDACIPLFSSSSPASSTTSDSPSNSPSHSYHRPNTLNEKEKFSILQSIVAHSQYCMAGDNTITAAALAMKRVGDKKNIGDSSDGSGDDSLSLTSQPPTRTSDYNKFVIVLSDCNLRRYGIRPVHLSKLSQADSSVSLHWIFIAEGGGGGRKEGEDIVKEVPSSTLCTESTDLPGVFRAMLSDALVSKGGE